MRKNIFLHFMNRDSREIFGLFKFQESSGHYRLLRRSLNISAVLCEDFCVMPPGFVIEDEIAFDLAESQREFLASRLIRFPLREANLADYAEKKRVEYMPMRDRYSGLFNDDRLSFLGRNAEGLIRRTTLISEGIVAGWEAGPDSSNLAWAPVKRLLPGAIVEAISKTPRRLHEDDVAVTWSAISPNLPNGAIIASRELRDALQYTYFKQYCDEFDAIIVAGIPYMIEEFYLPRRVKSYSYARFEAFLRAFSLDQFILDAPARLIVDLRRRPGFIAFVDAYVQLAELVESATDVAFAAARAASATSFDFEGFRARNRVFTEMPSELELLELDDALLEVATGLVVEFGFSVRLTIGAGSVVVPEKLGVVAEGGPLRLGKQPMAQVVFYIALEEELAVFAGLLGLERNYVGPAASGKVGGLSVEVLCAKDMGRVPAAVEVGRHLESRKGNLPKLILIVGLAGGFEEGGSAQGHLISATAVVDLAHRKISEDEQKNTVTKFRRRDFQLSRALWDVLTSNAFDEKAWVEESIAKADWPKDRRPSLHTGLLASVDEVIANDSWRKELLKHTDKLLGVEMEAGGVCAAAEKYGVPVSMLRAVSDTADPAKSDDKWRSIGMKTIAYLVASAPLDKVLQVLGR